MDRKEHLGAFLTILVDGKYIPYKSTVAELITDLQTYDPVIIGRKCGHAPMAGSIQSTLDREERFGTDGPSLDRVVQRVSELKDEGRMYIDSICETMTEDYKLPKHASRIPAQPKTKPKPSNAMMGLLSRIKK